MNLPEVRLIQLPIETACAVKWQSGRQKYGPIFRTNPLEELYADDSKAKTALEIALSTKDKLAKNKELSEKCLASLKAITDRVVSLDSDVFKKCSLFY